MMHGLTTVVDNDDITYDNWIDDAPSPPPPSNPPLDNEYDDWATSDHHVLKTEQPPPVEDLYDEFVDPGKDASNQEYEDVEGQGDIFGFDNKMQSSSTTATSPSWVNKSPVVKGTPPSAKKFNSAHPPSVPKSPIPKLPTGQPPPEDIVYECGQDVGNQEYEDVEGQGDIFGFDNKKGTSTNTATTPGWANKAPEIKGIPPSRRPVSMKSPPNLPDSNPPKGRPMSMQSPTYGGSADVQSSNENGAAAYEIPLSQSYMNIKPQDEGESYEEMGDVDLKPTYVNVTSQDVGGESYEEVDDLDLKKSTPSAPPTEANDEYYVNALPDQQMIKTTMSIAERQQQLQKKETKEPPKRRGLAADYQKMKFEMLAQKFKEIDSGETKSEPTRVNSDKKAKWPPQKTGTNDANAPEKGTVNTLTKSFQLSGTDKGKDKANMKGLLWHKPPGRSKYHEEHCELEGSNLKLFHSKNDPKPYFTINTAQCELAPAPEEYEKKNVFKLTAGASRDYFGAFNAGEMKSWMNALRPVVKAAK